MRFENEGIAKGERVALMAKPSIDAVSIALAVIRAGAILLLIDPQLDIPSFIHILNDVAPKLLA